MFNILTFVRVAPATTDVHIILEVPATDKIHIEDRYGLAELSQTMGYTTRKTVNWFARKQLHLNYVVPQGAHTSGECGCNTAVSTKVVPQQHKSARENADCYYG